MTSVAIHWDGLMLSGTISDDWLLETAHFLNPQIDRFVCASSGTWLSYLSDLLKLRAFRNSKS